MVFVVDKREIAWMTGIEASDVREGARDAVLGRAGGNP
jgi:hypothetical protein